MTPGANRKGVLFVDLDGTLVLDNSFHAFMWAGMRRGDLSLRVALVLAAVMRLGGTRFGGHERMKRRVLTAFQKASSDLQAEVIEETLAAMRSTLSGPVLAVVDRWRSDGYIVVVATAAPECYARPFAGALGIADCIATPSIPAENWTEVRADLKLRACRAWLNQAGLEGPDTRIGVITDDVDDQPLVDLATDVFIQSSPSEFLRFALNGAAHSAVHIDTTSAQPCGGIWLWFDDKPSGPWDLWEVRTVLSKHRYSLLYVGEGQWKRVGPGADLSTGVQRFDTPAPPSIGARLAITARRRLVRDRLGVFH